MRTEADWNRKANEAAYTATLNELNTNYVEATEALADAQRRINLYANQTRLTEQTLNLLLKSFAADQTVHLLDLGVGELGEHPFGPAPLIRAARIERAERLRQVPESLILSGAFIHQDSHGGGGVITSFDARDGPPRPLQVRQIARFVLEASRRDQVYLRVQPDRLRHQPRQRRKLESDKMLAGQEADQVGSRKDGSAIDQLHRGPR